MWHRDRLSFRAIDDEQVLAASFGEVRHGRPADPAAGAGRPGQACQSVFGPVRDHECRCRRIRGARHAGEVCPKCGVEVTDSQVRRRRMGHIELAAPIIHPWYKDRLGDALGLGLGALDDIVHGRCHVVRDGDRDEFVFPPAGAEPRHDEARLCTGAADRAEYTTGGDAIGTLTTAMGARWTDDSKALERGSVLGSVAMTAVWQQLRRCYKGPPSLTCSSHVRPVARCLVDGVVRAKRAAASAATGSPRTRSSHRSTASPRASGASQSWSTRLRDSSKRGSAVRGCGVDKRAAMAQSAHRWLPWRRSAPAPRASIRGRSQPWGRGRQLRHYPRSEQ